MRTPRLTPGLWLPLLFVAVPVLAALAPGLVQPASYHQFADQRMWLYLPHAADVLSNLVFAWVAAWGLVSLRAIPALALPVAQRQLCALFLYGLLLTTLCSGWYHLAPDDARLSLDRAGMSVAFAGLLGLASEVHLRTGLGRWVAISTVAAAAFGIAWSQATGNIVPWASVQAVGLALLLVCAQRSPLQGSLRVRWLWVVLAYALAKALELADTTVWAWSHEHVAGHTLKHIVAALAALPVVFALRRMRQNAFRAASTSSPL